jgi:hypothetical protein
MSAEFATVANVVTSNVSTGTAQKFQNVNSMNTWSATKSMIAATNTFVSLNNVLKSSVHNLNVVNILKSPLLRLLLKTVVARI